MRLPERDGVALPAVQLEAILAGVAGAGDETLRARHLPGVEMIVGDVGELVARSAAGAVASPSAPARASSPTSPEMSFSRTLAPPFWADDVLPGRRHVGRIHHDHQLVVEPVDGAVVDEGAFGREDRGVLHAARLERGDVVAGDPVDEARSGRDR